MLYLQVQLGKKMFGGEREKRQYNIQIKTPIKKQSMGEEKAVFSIQELLKISKMIPSLHYS